MKNEYKKAMVFGVFDGLHAGHLFFLRQSQKINPNLIIVVTQDEVVKKQKNYLPQSPAKDRLRAVKNNFPTTLVCLGDKKIGSWEIIKKHKPDMVIVGYDQIELKNSLEKIRKDYNFKIISVKNNHRGKEIHSSLLRNK